MPAPFLPSLSSAPQAPPLPGPRWNIGQTRRWRLPALCALLLLALGGNIWLARITPPMEAAQNGFVTLWLLTYLPYLAASALIVSTAAPGGRSQRLELIVLFAGALALRLPFLFDEPNLSRDSWRYLWDARVFLHNYSPYVYPPASGLLLHLRDFIYTNSRFRTVPSIYPPGAEYVYILSYLLVPSSLSFLKGVFLLSDLGSCGLLARLLARKGLDPARVILYAWCPLPIVEFALEGHVDVIVITACLLVVFVAQSSTTRGRVLTGVLIGIATLTKLYPILLLAPLGHLRAWRRESLLVLACLLTIAAGYLPFFLMGHGEILGYFPTYANEQGQNAGLVQQLVLLSGWARHLPLATTISQEHLIAFLLLMGLALSVFVLRQRELISKEAGVLALFTLVLSVSSHVFPWYTTTLLPWIILLLPAHWRELAPQQRAARLLALGGLWTFACLSILSYYSNWIFYSIVVDGLLALGLVLAAWISAPLLVLRLWKKDWGLRN